MSQAGIVDFIGTHPEIPTQFDANVGFAVPIANTLEILGETVVAGTNPFRSVASGNTVTYQAQISQAIASTDATKIGLSNFSSAHFSVDANGFVTLAGGGQAIDSIGTQTGINPIVPTAAGLVTINGDVVLAGSNPVRSNGTGVNTMSIEIQKSQAIASTDATKIGLSAYNSADFNVDANGFVSLNLSTWTDQGTSTTINANSNYFATAAVTLTLPASPVQGDVIEIYVDTASSVVIQANTGQTIRIGTSTSSVAGTLTNTARGDYVKFIYRSTGALWAATGSGTWTPA